MGNQRFDSNNIIMVLSTIDTIVFLTTIEMQLIRREDLNINLWALMTPFLMLVLLHMFLVAAIAVLFETRPLLCGGIGNVTYIFYMADRPPTLLGEHRPI